MDTLATSIQARRLDRLRADRDSAPPILPPSAHAESGDRAHVIADALGGRVEHHGGRSVVIVEASGSLPVERERLASLPDPIEPSRPIVCLDAETTGLGTAAGTVPFLVGIGSWADDRFSVRQFLLIDHSHESALLAALADAIPADAWLVTYNGRSFDWPLLVARYRLHRRDPPSHAGHLDLLPLSRQVWRHRLPDARLASVEAGIAGVRRVADLPGALIPNRYFDFLRTGRSDLLADIVRHNRQDVASLGRLLACLGRGLDPESFGTSMHPGDLGGLGRAYVRRRRYVSAMACFDAAIGRAGGPEADGAGDPADRVPALTLERTIADRARLLTRLGRHDEAAAAWLGIANGSGRMVALAWVQVAKHREHRQRDVSGALAAAELAARIAARARFVGRPATWLERDLDHRIARLRGRPRQTSFGPFRLTAA